jgi:hypothetical protein
VDIGNNSGVQASLSHSSDNIAEILCFSPTLSRKANDIATGGCNTTNLLDTRLGLKSRGVGHRLNSNRMGTADIALADGHRVSLAAYISLKIHSFLFWFSAKIVKNQQF